MRSDSNTQNGPLNNNSPKESIKNGFRVLPWGFYEERSYSGSIFKPLTETLANLVEQLPDELITAAEVSNVSGAAPDATGLGELLRISYEAPTEHTTEADPPSYVPGILTIHSKFVRFEESRAIVFGLQRASDEESSNPRALILDAAKKITAISLQLQWYERRWASLFGLFPVPTKMLKINLEEGKFVATVTVQRQPSAEIARDCAEAITAQYLTQIVF